jgi:hypothetical protein
MARTAPWRVPSHLAYLRGMGRRRRTEPMEPERRLAELDNWVGLWVAVKDGEVIAAASTSLDLVDAIHKLRPVGIGKGAVAQYVPRPTDEIMIGVG